LDCADFSVADRGIGSVLFIGSTKEIIVKKQALQLVKEFQQFAMKGNVIDMAVGIIIGAAFGKIISSLVADIIMPPIGYLMGGVDFSSLKFALKPASGADPGVALNYGLFINSLINFVIVAFAMFVLVRALIVLKHKEEVAPSQPPKPTNEEILLTEIRDLLKRK
jgi:large conductance mechanosensitive channel